MSIYSISSIKFFFIALSLCSCLYIAVTTAKKYCFNTLSLKKEINIMLTIIYSIWIATVSFFPFSINYTVPFGANFIPSNINILPFSALIFNIEKLMMPFPSFFERLKLFSAFLFGNLLLFMPLGFLLPQISKKFNNYRLTAIVIFLIAFIKETLQFIESSYGAVLNRNANTDDLILNVIGGIIGTYIVKQLKNKL